MTAIPSGLAYEGLSDYSYSPSIIVNSLHLHEKEGAMLKLGTSFFVPHLNFSVPSAFLGLSCGSLPSLHLPQVPSGHLQQNYIRGLLK